MNKQALAFLTMFSLVLMLSVYYVTLPSDSTTVMSEDSNKEKEQNQQTEQNTSKQTTKSASEELQNEIDQKKESEKNENSQIVANKDSEENKKQEALATMETIEKEQKDQTVIKEALQKEKIATAVEIKDTTCTINVFDQKDDKELAEKIMKTVNNLTNNKYLIEVTFK